VVKRRASETERCRERDIGRSFVRYRVEWCIVRPNAAAVASALRSDMQAVNETFEQNCGGPSAIPSQGHQSPVCVYSHRS
jgi:hypothetical protein